MPVRIPVVEMIEIGAGGGSIAAVDILGRLTVGPRSAGSEPGPAAFGRGGTDATVTDADVALGYISPDAFAEGRLTIDPDAALGAIERNVGAPLALPTIEAARGISDIVDESMASAGRMHAVESGKDLSDRVMIAFGGNGPLHATRVARRAGISTILIPPNPGVGSAVGFLDAPVSFEIVRSRYTTLADCDVEDINALFRIMIAEATSVVQAGAPDVPTAVKRVAFMRYHGQGHEIEIALPDRDLGDTDTETLTGLFEKAYRAQFTRSVPGMTIEIMNWSVLVSTIAPSIASGDALSQRQNAKPFSTRSIVCDLSGSRVEADLYARDELAVGDTLNGPALVVEPQTTTLVSAEFSASVDADRNLILTKREGEP